MTSSPLVAGGHGRLWISPSGEVRLELQSESGDTEIYWKDGTLTVYDVASHTAYTYTPPAHGGPHPAHASKTPPSVAQIEEAIAKLEKHAEVPGAQPTDVGGRGGVHGPREPARKGQPDRGRRAQLRRRTASAARRDLLDVQLGAGDGTRGRRNRLRIARSVDIRIQAARREPRSRWSSPPAPRLGRAGARPTLPTHAGGPTATGDSTAVGEIQLKSKGRWQRPEAAFRACRPSRSAQAKARELKTALGTILTFEQVRRALTCSPALWRPAAVEAARA